MRGFYGPPIAVHGVPGNVRVCGDGDFIGEISEGFEMSAKDRFEDILRRAKAAARVASSNTYRRQRSQLNAGFTSLSDLINEFTAQFKGQQLYFSKVIPMSTVAAATMSSWTAAGQPIAGTASSAAAPSGTQYTSATAGALNFFNPITGGDNTYFINANVANGQVGTLLLYDRLFGVAKTASSTSTEAVTGVPTRYQNTTAGAADYIGGNFMFIETATALGASAHNWTVCQYKNQANSTQSLPSVTGVASTVVGRLDMPTGTWFAPLASGDIGVKAITQMQCSASNTGVVNFCIGHPIAFMPCLIANSVTQIDGLNTAFNLTRIFDSACLSFLDICRSAATSTTWTGNVTMCAG
jgi:hypothetical protein